MEEILPLNRACRLTDSFAIFRDVQTASNEAFVSRPFERNFTRNGLKCVIGEDPHRIGNRVEAGSGEKYVTELSRWSAQRKPRPMPAAGIVFIKT